MYAFWYSVLNDADLLCSKIEDTEVTIEEWYKQKDVIINQSNHEMLTVGFATFFLNRTNRSGILSGGVIGGKKQDGNWKIDERFNKKNLIDRIMNIYSKRHMIDLYNLDAVEFIKKIVVKLPKNSLTYLDPPYYLKGKELYVNHYKHQDHVDLAMVVRKINTPWVVSYDNTDEIQKMYRVPSLVYGINYSAQDRYKGSEVMFFRKNLNIPETKDPIKMKIPKIYSVGHL